MLSKLEARSEARPDSKAAKSRPRLLMLATQPFYPVNTGARMRNYFLARELAAQFDVTYLSFSDKATKVTEFEIEPDPAIDINRVVKVPPPARYRLKNLVLGAIGPTPLTVLNYTSKLMARTLEQLLEEFDFDFVQMESIHLFEYLSLIRAASARSIVTLDWHNVESELMRRYSAAERNPARKAYARVTAAKLERIERQALAQFDVQVVVSERDRMRLLGIAPDADVHLALNGADIEGLSAEAIDGAFSRSNRKPGGLQRVYAAVSGSDRVYDRTLAQPGCERRRLVFVGSMDYRPNQDAMLHFAREVWPDVHAARPNLELTIVGRSPSADIRVLELVPGIEVTGTVEDVRPYYRDAIASIVPLRIGGGSRLKILEAMAAGVPVISTPLGAEGLAVEDGGNILLASSPAEFRAAIDRIYDNADEHRRLSQAGRELAIEKYSWSRVGKGLAQMYAQMAQRRRSDQGGLLQISASGSGLRGAPSLRRREIGVQASVGEVS